MNDILAYHFMTNTQDYVLLEKTIQSLDELKKREIVSEYTFFDRENGKMCIVKFNRHSYQSSHITEVIKSMDDIHHKLISFTYTAHNNTVIIFLEKR